MNNDVTYSTILSKPRLALDFKREQVKHICFCGVEFTGERKRKYCKECGKLSPAIREKKKAEIRAKKKRPVREVK